VVGTSQADKGGGEVYEKDVEERIQNIDRVNLPDHVAIIMDGNGRWAAVRNLARIEGHRAGIKTVQRVVRLSGRLGIKFLTLYTFSRENWKRPESEVRDLMRLLSDTLYRELEELNRNNVRLMTIGETDSLPLKNRLALNKAIKKTSVNTGLVLNLAISYGGRSEILLAVKKVCRDVVSKRLKIDDLDSRMFSRYLDTADIPDPDLFIRTSGEFRISNFLLWQLAYTEIWVTDVLWPDFTESDFLDALDAYKKRERRFGKTSDQLRTESWYD